MESTNTALSLFENSVPPFVEDDIERLYQNPYATVAHHRMSGGLTPGISTYVARRSGEPAAVFLFSRESGHVRVLNEQVRLDAHEINRFARHVFSQFGDVHAISFHAISTDARRISYPCQHFTCTEDIVLEMPSSAEAYRARMGKSTRSYIQRYMNKLRRDFPTLRHEVQEAGQVSEQTVRDIIALNTARMTDKQRESYIDEAEAARIMYFARTRGLVSAIMLDGRLCAGAINFRLGGHYYLKVIAHDPAFNAYRLGTLCCYLAICECIARGGSEYHFLWGRYEYKYRLLGVQRDLDHVTLYRSRVQMLLHARLAAMNLYSACRLEGRDWLLRKLKDSDAVAGSLRACVAGLRQARRLKGLAMRLPPRQRGAADETGGS